MRFIFLIPLEIPSSFGEHHSKALIRKRKYNPKHADDLRHASEFDEWEIGDRHALTNKLYLLFEA
jgi:hypothetical protein